MNWLGRLLRRRPALHPELALALAAYRARSAVAGSAALAELRFVVVDVETTGLDPFADRLISIGAVEVVAGKLRLNSSFEVVFRQSRESTRDNILVHGIDGSTQRSGIEPAAAMLRFLDYAERSPLVGYHADFDRIMIERAARETIGSVPLNGWLDLAFLAPALLCGPQQAPPQGLDGWMSFAGITNESRHNALADAVATAQLLQVVLARARAAGAATLDDLSKIEKDRRWLGREA